MNGEFDGIPNCGALKLPGDAKCGEPNAGPELPGRPNGGAPDGEPNGPLKFSIKKTSIKLNCFISMMILSNLISSFFFSI